MADKKTIVAVDDEEDIRDTIKTLLESEDYNVVTAKSADELLDKLEDEDPDLILLDIMMPGTPVKEAVKEIKDTKILYVSVVQTAETEKEELMKQDNVVGFIQKPFDTDELLEKVKKEVE